MGKLYGYIVSIKELLENVETSIKTEIDGIEKSVHKFVADRTFTIPDFQREIRWKPENVEALIDDISKKEKHLGNIILTEKNNNYDIIDGQQRITTILMIISYIQDKYGTQITVFKTCNFNIESFKKFNCLLENKFNSNIIKDQSIIDTDKLQQKNKYLEIWDTICKSSVLATKQSAKDFLSNLENCTANIVLNKTDGIAAGIGYFIDVNLKGLQLDDEDVFKSYLFKNDQSQEIRLLWYSFKQKQVLIQQSKLEYPLLKLIEHFLYCDLYNNSKFDGLIFKENLCLVAPFSTKELPPESFRKDTHIVEVINDKSYFIQLFDQLNKVIDIMLCFVENTGINKQIMECLSAKSNGKVDNNEIAVIHNLISKILKDKNILPKALVMKYIMNVILSSSRTKTDVKKIYGVYLLSVMFVVFENKKSKDAFSNVLKASSSNWYIELIAKVKGQFDNAKPTQAKLIAGVGHVQNENEEDYRFRCKSIATIYNFFKISNKTIVCKPIDKVKAFLTNDIDFSTEHFIISDSETIKVLKSDRTEFDYTILQQFKKLKIGFFNFLFIPQTLNNDLANYWLPEKLKRLSSKDIECNYSKMIINKVSNLSQEMKNNESPELLDTFFSRKFNDLYIEYARSVLAAVIDQLTDTT